MGIPESRVLEVKEAADIVEVVSVVVPLQKAGKSFKARCPFHEERTPSFFVHPDRQTYHCFGCGAGGDVYTFLMTYERLDFPTAVRTLAEQVGIPIEQESGPGPRGSEVYRYLDFGRRFFRRCLEDPEEGRSAREYLAHRGFSREVVERFEIGYAPARGRALLDIARRKGLDPEALEEAGLIIGGRQGAMPIDRFRHRLIFPIADLRGRTVGFGGRILGEGEPKYLNSPESPHFSKRKLLYGAHLARDAARREGRTIVVEGYTDVVLAHQEGVAAAVGSLGTAFTEAQARLLARLSGRVVLVFDPDAAGAAAAERGLDVLLARGLQVKVARLAGGKDPFDTIRDSGGRAFAAMVDRSEDFFEYKLRAARQRHDLSTSGGEAAAARELLQTISMVSDPIQKEILYRRASETLGISEGALRAAASGLRSPRAGPKRPGAASTPTAQAPGSRNLEAGLIELMVSRPDIAAAVVESVGIETFRGEAHRVVAEGLYRQIREAGKADVQALLVRLRDEKYCRILVEAEAGAGGDKDYDRFWADVRQRLRLRSLDERLGRLRREMMGAKDRGDETASSRIYEEYASCLKEREKIRAVEAGGG